MLQGTPGRFVCYYLTHFCGTSEAKYLIEITSSVVFLSVHLLGFAFACAEQWLKRLINLEVAKKTGDLQYFAFFTVVHVHVYRFSLYIQVRNLTSNIANNSNRD